MKICKTCNEIVAMDQACSREGCPALSDLGIGSAPVIEPGLSGNADSAVQESLDYVGYVARDASRRAALITSIIVTVLLIAGVVGYKLIASTASDELITVEISSRANVRDAPKAQGSNVIETLSPGAELTGRWVNGSSDPSERWLEFERGGESAFVWGGNLSMTEGSSIKENVIKAKAKPSCSATLWDGREVKGPCDVKSERDGNFSVTPLGALERELWTTELYFEPSEGRISLAPPCSPGCSGSVTRARRDPSNSQCWINLSNPSEYVHDNFQRFCVLG